jgi:hypothetical protein
VLPWQPVGWKVRFAADGGSATGTFHDPASFMPARSQRTGTIAAGQGCLCCLVCVLPNCAVSDQDGACGATSGAPRARLSLGRFRPARPRRPTDGHR